MRRRITFANAYALTATVCLFAFSIANCMRHNTGGCILEMVCALFGVFSMVQLRKTCNIERAQKQILLYIAVVFLYLLVSGGIERTGVSWWFSFPVAAFFFSGRRKGWYWIISLLLAGFLCVLALPLLGVDTPYSLVELRQYLVAFLALCVVIQYYEITRKEHQETIQKNYADLKEAHGRVRKLSGLLPICARCKKVRDDSGYWHQVEEYIGEHSEVDFSHALCDECARELHPDLSE